MFLMTLRRLEVRLLINTRQREAKGGEGRGGGWGRGMSERRKIGKKMRKKVND